MVVVADVPVAFVNVRLVVLAVPKYPVPDTLNAVEDAYGAVRSAAAESVIEPMLLIVVVDVPPKYAVSKIERRVDDACTKLLAVEEVAVRYGMVIAPERVCAPDTVKLPVNVRSPESVPPASGK